MEERIEDIRPVRPKIGPGFRVGRLTVTEATGERKNGYTIWRCRCDCGGEALLDTRCLQRGTTTDCGCASSAAPLRGIRDVTGLRFGKLTALMPTKERGMNGSVIWRCRCDCGNEVLVPLCQMTKGYVKSCGCLSHPPIKDLTGERFGRLTVVAYDGKRDGKHYWRCQCECGGEAVVAQSNLRSGKTQSCGCLNKEQLIRSLGIVDGTCIRHLEYYQRNLSARNTRGYNGVYQDKRSGKWQAQVSVEGKTRSLGRYSSKVKAIQARQRVDRQIAGYLEQYYEDHPEWKRPVDE